MAEQRDTADDQAGLRGALQRIGNSVEVSVEAALQTVLRLIGQEGFSFEALATLVEVTDSRIWNGLLHSAAHPRGVPGRSREDELTANRLQSAVSTAFTSRQGAASVEARRRALLDGLESPDPDVRCLAAELLGRRGDPDAVEPIAALIEDRNDHVRAGAVRALSALPSDRVMPYLLRALERYDVVSAEAVNGLARIGQPAVEPLLGELRGGSAWTRWHAAKALGGIGDRRAAGALIDALTDDDSSVRWESVYALAQIGPAALEPLLRAIETRPVTPWFAEGAARVLGRIATGELHPLIVPLERVLHHQTAPIEAPVEAARALEQVRALRRS